MQLKRFSVGMLETNCFVIWQDQDAVVIDPGAEETRITAFLEENSLLLQGILLTHGHGDHIGSVGILRKKYPEAKVVCHELDAPMLTDSSKNLTIHMGFDLTVGKPDILITSENVLELGKIRLEVRHVPGHTPGHVIFIAENQFAIVGDTLFARGIGRWDLPGGNGSLLIKSIQEKIFSLPDHIVVWPGHGPETTVGNERESNPYFHEHLSF